MAKFLTDRNVAKERLQTLIDAQHSQRWKGCIYVSHNVDLERSKYIEVFLTNINRWRHNWPYYNKVIYIPCIQDSHIIILKDDK